MSRILALLSLVSLAGCLSGNIGPYAGKTYNWYVAHKNETIAEVNACTRATHFSTDPHDYPGYCLNASHALDEINTKEFFGPARGNY